MNFPAKNLQYFNQYIKPNLPSYYRLSWSNYAGGSFGDLHRLEFESPQYLGTVDFWSKDWVAIDLVDISVGKEILNSLFSPEEEHDVRKCLQRLLEILSNE